MRGKNVFWHSVLPFIGSVVGVGIFGLPYIFAKAGFPIGMAYMLVLATVNALVLFAYSDIVMHTKGHARLTGFVKNYLGEGWSWIATILAFGTSWGAMVAYIVIGGTFLHTLLAPFFGGNLGVYQWGFFLITSFLLIGGLGFITHLEKIFVGGLLAALLVILGGSVSFVDVAHLQGISMDYLFSPFGVVLFAFGGIAVVPEMADILGKKKQDLKKAILVGMFSVTVIYLLFTTVVVGVSGARTTQDAVTGLGGIAGEWVTILGSIVGLISVFTSFLILGISLMDTLIYDYRRKYLPAWAVVVSVPFVVFLLGARSFISVIGYTGGILGSLMGLLVMYMYLRTKSHNLLPKRTLTIPSILMYLAAGVYTIGLILTVFSL